MLSSLKIHEIKHQSQEFNGLCTSLKKKEEEKTQVHLIRSLHLIYFNYTIQEHDVEFGTSYSIRLARNKHFGGKRR